MSSNPDDVLRARCHASESRKEPLGIEVGKREASERVDGTVAKVVAEGKDVTYDLRPDRDPSNAATTGMAEAVIAATAA